MKNNRNIIDVVNIIFLTENAKVLKDENSLLIDSELDSFGYAILWIELDEEYGCFSIEYIDSIDYETYTLKDLYERANNAN